MTAPARGVYTVAEEYASPGKDEQMKIAVLAGGWSPEREVSLTSGTLISNALIGNGHSVALVDVYTGMDLPEGDVNRVFRQEPFPPHVIRAVQPDLAALKAQCGNGEALIGRHVIDICRAADIVFPALHGGMGENGQLQATLDAFGIRYTGSGYAGCLLSMDKDVSKRLFRDAGILTPDWVYFDADTPLCDRRAAILDKIGVPCVVKPCSCGSSVGVTIVETEEELDRALAAAQEFGACILVERKISGRELTVGVLDGKALPAVEILPADGFYDYKNKYSGSTVELCPAPIDEASAKAAALASLRGMKALHLDGYARFDYILDDMGNLYCLEANALPGMTPTSLFPRAAGEAGISYSELCERIISLALRK